MGCSYDTYEQEILIVQSNVNFANHFHNAPLHDSADATVLATIDLWFYIYATNEVKYI